MSLKLAAAQRRVLGVLIEKSLTTPGSYPMSLNALVTGCNQLTCREPVMRLTEPEVSKAVQELHRMGLVKQADADRNARVYRFRHNIEEQFGWDNRQRAIIAELLLRGPQTIGELRTNAARMTPITDLQYVADLLATFANQDPPLVRELPKQPGRAVPRFDHLFYPDDEPRPVAESSTAVPCPAPSALVADAAPASAGPDLSGLEARVAKLEEELAALREQFRMLTGG